MDKSQYIFGLRAIMEAIEAGKEIDKIMLRKDLGGDLARELIHLIRQRDIVTQRVPEERLNRITRKNHQGAIAILSPVTYYKLDNLLPTLYEEGAVPLVLVLDSITDTRNFGAIARTAECAGVDMIVIGRTGNAAITPDAIKTSAGALLHIPICRERSIPEAIDFLRQSGVQVIGTTDAAEQMYTDIDYTIPTAIVMGAEDTGMSAEVMRKCDVQAAIPVMGHISSLNVSVAAGVVAYEATNQRLKSGMTNA